MYNENQCFIVSFVSLRCLHIVYDVTYNIRILNFPLYDPYALLHWRRELVCLFPLLRPDKVLVCKHRFYYSHMPTGEYLVCKLSVISSNDGPDRKHGVCEEQTEYLKKLKLLSHPGFRDR